MAANRSNLISPNTLDAPCNLEALQEWVQGELQQVRETAVRGVVAAVCEHLDAFVRWPVEALLLWEGCNRTVKYHAYPEIISQHAKGARVYLDRRTNGPAIASFVLAGGDRPPRFGSTNAWSVHHVYSGKFPYPGREETLHAAKHGCHFTQSAGLVAIHPIADQMADEYPFFSWLLRAHAFQRFGYDPDGVFCGAAPDLRGFAHPRSCRVLCL